MRVARIEACALVLAACSLVNDPGRHEGTPGTDGGGVGSDGGASDAGSSDGGAPPVAAEDACEEFTNVYCTAYDRCCMMMPRRSFDECVTDVLASCNMSIEQFLFHPPNRYSPERAGELIARARTMSATCDPAIAELLTYELLAVFEGSALETQPCISLAEIGRSEYAGLLSCSRADGLTCRPETGPLDPWACQAISVTGGSCYHFVHCQEGHYCSGIGIFNNGSCTRQRSNGMKCSSADQCDSLNCSMGFCRSLDQSVYCTDLLPQAPMADMAM